MERSVLELFLFNHNLKFNEIEKKIGIRSNKLTYHLNKLIKKGILEKDDNKYKLSEESETIIPYVTNKSHVLPVVLIALESDKGIFLVKREKRPYQGKLGLPGGRIILGEKLSESVKRIMKNKFRIKCSLKKVNSVSLEQVKSKKRIVHSFLLIFVTAKTNEKLEYISLEKNKEKIISSDYELIKKDFNKEIKIKNIISKI